jgi:hypothetical protein
MRAIPLICLCLALLTGCARNHSVQAPTERQQRIGRLQDFSEERGFRRTGNFRSGAPDKEAYFLCYYAPKWELPDSYDDLGYRESKTSGCGIDESKYDVYLHKVEAVAFEDTPVTASLEATTEERALMVAAHEEVHEDPQLERLPHPVAEGASTLLGILTAAEFARKEGDIQTATRLSGDAVMYHKKALFVNALHARLRDLYAKHRAGKIGRTEIASAKEAAFAEAARECATFGVGHSLNPCLPVSNNAGLAFDHSYTRWYPALYRLYLACGSDLDEFLRELRSMGNLPRRNISAIAKRIEERTAARESAKKPPP